MILKIKFHKAQAVAEMAIFGSLIIGLFSTLLFYIQRLNDEQFTTMETFRYALQKAHGRAEDPGFSVSYSAIEMRRNVDLNNPLKGSRSQTSASASVYWAVPEVGEKPENRNFYKVNEYEFEYDYEDMFGEYNPEEYDVETEIETIFVEHSHDTFSKQESKSGIATTRVSDVDDRIDFRFKFTKKRKDDENDEGVTYTKEVEQVLFSDGKYRNIDFVDEDGRGLHRGLHKERRWVTSF